jgi:DNA-binding transcriptional MerR regulator
MVGGANTTARAVRFYEAQSLIQAAVRSRGGHRLFERSELDKLRLVLDLRTCGFSIEEIRDILEAKARGATVAQAAQTVQNLLSSHIRELQRKISVIERLGREFNATVHVLDRCVHCTDPRGPEACATCDVPRSASAPPSFLHIWSPSAKCKNRTAG